MVAQANSHTPSQSQSITDPDADLLERSGSSFQPAFLSTPLLTARRRLKRADLMLATLARGRVSVRHSMAKSEYARWIISRPFATFPVASQFCNAATEQQCPGRIC